MMKLVKPVFWYQGLFLQPQHFQQSDRFSQSLLSSLYTYQQPFFWGVCRIKIDEAALAEQTLEISLGEFVFQDGTHVGVPDNAVIIPHTFEVDELEPGEPFKIYLGLRKWDLTEDNVTILKKKEELATVTTRYVCLPGKGEARDLYQKGPVAEVKLLDYALRVFIESEAEDQDRYHLLPVGQLEYDGNELKLSRAYIPPLVSVSGSEILVQIVQNIRELVGSRCRKLEGYKASRGLQSEEEVEPGYLIILMALRSLNKYLPVLHHLSEASEIHPWQVYGLLRQLIGELSTFSERIDSLGRLQDGTELLPMYDHTDLRKCFDEAQLLIGEVLSALSIGPESIIQLERDGGYFKAQISAELFAPRNTFYMVLRTAESQGKVQAAMRDIAKLSSIEFMETLIARALPGLSLEQKLVPPPGLPVQTNSYFFEIDLSHEQWVEIQKNQSICLFWDQAPKDTKVQLIVLKR